MIIYGTGGNVVDLGRDEFRECPTCGRIQPFRVMLRYRYVHLWYAFGVVDKKEYLSVCKVCHQTVSVKKKEIEPLLERLPIPFMERYGMLCLFASIAAVILVFV